MSRQILFDGTESHFQPFPQNPEKKRMISQACCFGATKWKFLKCTVNNMVTVPRCSSLREGTLCPCRTHSPTPGGRSGRSRTCAAPSPPRTLGRSFHAGQRRTWCLAQIGLTSRWPLRPVRDSWTIGLFWLLHVSKCNPPYKVGYHGAAPPDIGVHGSP